jgi:hypothetical protein
MPGVPASRQGQLDGPASLERMTLLIHFLKIAGDGVWIPKCLKEAEKGFLAAIKSTSFRIRRALR